MSSDKKQRIMQAVEQVLRTHRVNEVTLDEIARQADVGKGTIYLYFTDKEDLIFQAATAGFDEMCQRLREPGAPDAGFRGTLLQACETMAAFFQARRPLFRVVLSEGERAMESSGSGPGLRERWRERRRTMAEAVAAIIAQGMAAGEIRADIPAEILAEFLLGMLRTRSWELEGWPEAQRSLALLVDVFTNGAGAPAHAAPTLSGGAA